MNKKLGSITIEASIAFSIFLILITYVVNVVVIYKTDMLMQRAVNKTCEEFSIFTPLSVIATDTVSTLINAAPEGFVSNIDNSSTEIVSNIIGMDIASANSISSTILDFSLSQKFENDILNEYIRFNNDSDFFSPYYIDVDFNIDGQRNIIYVIVNYKIETIAGDVDRIIVSGIPFYGDMELFLYGDNSEEEQYEDVWNMNNFERGSFLINYYGGNLPGTFPVINGWDGSTATSITSINTSSNTYNDLYNFNNRIIEEINNLSDFNGADVTINGTEYVINSHEINEKVLIIVVPSNCDDIYVNQLQSFQSYADSRNIQLVIEQYGYV